MTDPTPLVDFSSGLRGIRQPERLSLASSIANSVAEAIAMETLAPGERIVELSLAKQMGVSRVPVREALKVLHAQGILSGGSHRGYRVATFDDTTVSNVIELRVKLETILLRDAIKQWHENGADLSGLDSAIDGMKIAAKIDDRFASLQADLEFHHAIAIAAGNGIAATLWDALARHVMIIFARDEYRDDNLKNIVGQHEAFRAYIERAIVEGHDEAQISVELQDHLLQVRRAKTGNGAARQGAK